jgi:hypothetical protein
VLDERIAALRQIAARLPAGVRLTLDPTERHGFEYQSWFGFQIFADGVRARWRVAVPIRFWANRRNRRWASRSIPIR